MTKLAISPRKPSSPDYLQPFTPSVKYLDLTSKYYRVVPYLRSINNIKLTTVASSPINRRYYCKQRGCTPKDLFPEANPYLQSSPILDHWFKNWQEERKYKLTASTFASAIGFWKRRRTQLWLEKLGSIQPFLGNLATGWSKVNEEEALEIYKLVTGNNVLFPEFQVYGDRNPEDSWLAASPDGIIDHPFYGLVSRGVLEIKCPFFGGDMSKATPWTRIPLYYIPQAQGLMEILDRDWMDFYVWTPKGSCLFRIFRDVEYWQLLKIALSDFWWQNVVPARELCCKSDITNPLVELKSYRPAPRHELCSEIVRRSKYVVANSELLMREIGGRMI